MHQDNKLDKEKVVHTQTLTTLVGEKRRESAALGGRIEQRLLACLCGEVPAFPDSKRLYPADMVMTPGLVCSFWYKTMSSTVPPAEQTAD